LLPIFADFFKKIGEFLKKMSSYPICFFKKLDNDIGRDYNDSVCGILPRWFEHTNLKKGIEI